MAIHSAISAVPENTQGFQAAIEVAHRPSDPDVDPDIQRRAMGLFQALVHNPQPVETEQQEPQKAITVAQAASPDQADGNNVQQSALALFRALIAKNNQTKVDPFV